MNTITRTFTDSVLTWKEPTRKNGVRKPIWSTVEVVDNLTPINVSFDGNKKTFYLREKEISEDRKTLNLYNEDGTFAKGSWRHGSEGSKIHVEGLELWAENRRLITISGYASGQIKDQKKYLLSI